MRLCKHHFRNAGDEILTAKELCDPSICNYCMKVALVTGDGLVHFVAYVMNKHGHLNLLETAITMVVENVEAKERTYVLGRLIDA